MKVLVTGGAGYIGTELTHMLIARPDVEQVVIYDNLSRPNHNFFLGLRHYNHSKIKFVKGELLDSRALRKVLKGIDVVYHLAAKVTTPFANSEAHIYEQVNHWGTAELVYAVEESNVKRFIYASSTGVYGSSNIPAHEDKSPDPKTFYAVSKLRGEEHVRRLIGKIDTYIMRCGNVYGYSKSMRFDAVINKFIFDANFSKLITIQGDGKQSRTFIHIDMLAKGLSNLLVADLPGDVYNIVDKNVTVLDILDILKELIPDLEFIFINQHLRLHELNVKVNPLITDTLQIRNNRSLKEELTEFLAKFSF
ncbi:NAD-dependent epimerase/dehydratase family protein [Chryseosolibacter indicus]|uniref:NAD-dependent epimerase/dehydratase family protein n=1 Tax=Chryseosolibacter indicus TaxID=2782351 RepID=A0ABS5VR32_9BACT|nr:NAD-dependent epimerase/dehydratase family protein [Chryseosolibacter indicus]MBT1703304.1 NAD-dependent epimerase/dehydratase family protein [Chryseosolibacter indicus]